MGKNEKKREETQLVNDTTEEKIINFDINNPDHSNPELYEVIEWTYESSDGRRPTSVEIGKISEDAARRDFTVNAIYYNPKSKTIFSPINSAISDVIERKLQFIGNPKDRIQEDYLRIFRFYRFIAEKGFVPEKKSLAACRQYFEEAVKSTSGERIRNEIERMVKL